MKRIAILFLIFIPVGLWSQSMQGPVNATIVNNAQYATTTAQLVAMVAAGGTIHVANGIYVLTGDLIVPSNTTIICDSWAADITMPNVSGTHNIINTTGASNVRIVGCNIDGTGMTATGQNSFTVYDPTGSNVEFSGNWIHDSPEDCIRLGPDAAFVAVPVNTKIENNTLTNCGTVGPSGSFVGVQSGSHVDIIGNIGITDILDGIDVEPETNVTDQPGATGDHIVIAGNVLDGGGALGNGISLFLPTTPLTGVGFNVSISGNEVSGFPGSAAYLISGPWRSVSISGGTGIDSVYGLQVEGTSDYSDVTVNSTACSISSNVVTITAANSYSLHDLLGIEGFSGGCAELDTHSIVLTAVSATQVSGNPDTPFSNLSTTTDAGVLARWSLNPVIVRGLNLANNGTGISCDHIGCNNNTFDATITDSATGIAEINGASGNHYSVSFKGNTTNIGAMGALSDVTNPDVASGGVEETCFSNVSGQNCGHFFSYNGNPKFGIFPGSLGVGDFNTYAQAGDYGMACLSATCSLLFGNETYGMRFNGTTGIWSINASPIPSAPITTVSGNIAAFANTTGSSLSAVSTVGSGSVVLATSLLGSGASIGTILQGTVTGIASGSATALVTLPNVPMSFWYICAGYVASNSASGFNACAVVSTSNLTSSISSQLTSTYVSLTMSGLALQVTQGSGGVISITYSALRIF